MRIVEMVESRERRHKHEIRGKKGDLWVWWDFVDFRFHRAQREKLFFSSLLSSLALSFSVLSKYSTPEENCAIRYEIDGENIDAKRVSIFVRKCILSFLLSFWR